MIIDAKDGVYHEREDTQRQDSKIPDTQAGR